MVVGTFYAGDLRAQYPRAYPDGNFDDVAKIAEIGADNKSLRLQGLPPEFILSRGDYLSFDYGVSRALHQVTETAKASNLFQVRPHIRPGAQVGTSVTLIAPTCSFRLTPQSITTTIRSGAFTVVSFSAFQAL